MLTCFCQVCNLWRAANLLNDQILKTRMSRTIYVMHSFSKSKYLSSFYMIYTSTHLLETEIRREWWLIVPVARLMWGMLSYFEGICCYLWHGILGAVHLILNLKAFYKFVPYPSILWHIQPLISLKYWFKWQLGSKNVLISNNVKTVTTLSVFCIHLPFQKTLCP